ncbi:M48 family metalloprotease [Breznakiella homolactica]|uniref:M48 family metalloprotease n=1 Tax=Breznakiella homolactica TaxID=2798577 RepID=A0A7T8BBB1_9SPIR|nr:M48 family metalloprotease [Breznakiella homolactica]QQO10221.1 M48 family metalloprotease [Breznakiella homolactica]
MKTQKLSVQQVCFLLAAVFSVLFLGSCSTLASVTSVGAQIAGGLGVIDQNTADAIAKSSDAIGKAAEEINPEQEYYIGRAVGANILTIYKPYTADPALTRYVNLVCQAVAVNSPRPELFNGYRVLILDSQEINAFATSGGHIFITRGLLDCAKSEDALAGVIAHEIAHIQLQHSIKAIKTSRITQAIVVTGTSAISVAADGTTLGELTDIFDESVNEIITTLVNSGYSQTQEFEADTLALSLMALAGYQPSCLEDMLKVLQQKEKGQSGGFIKTHPSASKRIENINKTVGTYHMADTRQYREARFDALF